MPPNPQFYKLFFDYVAGVKGLMADRVGQILTDGQGDERGRLYAEFIAPYETTETVDRALEQMVCRLRTLNKLVSRSAAATARHSASLAEADGKFGSDHLDRAILRDIVGRLDRSTRALQRANSALADELTEAHRELATIQVEIARSRDRALRDSLTGIANRGGVDFALARLIADAPDQPLCVALLDIDHFKSLNDGYGHQVGDQVLLIVARTLVASARASDIVGRPGGDEFVVILAGTKLGVAHNVADGIRAAVAASDLTEALGTDILGGITASIGVAQYEPGEPLSRTLDRADRCLYRAKQSGRNRVDSFAGLVTPDRETPEADVVEYNAA